jgi:hypothetical protein
MAERGRPDIEHTRDALREHDEYTEDPPEVPQPADEEPDKEEPEEDEQG